MITVKHPDGSISRIPVQNGGVTIAMGDRIVPTQEALCMDVTGDQPKPEDWKDWPVSSVSTAEHKAYETAKRDFFSGTLRKVLKANSNGHLNTDAVCDQIEEQAVRRAGLSVTRDASNSYQPENAHLHAVTTSLQPTQVLALVKAEADALKLALFDQFLHPLSKQDVLNRLHEIVRLVKLLPEGRLP